MDFVTENMPNEELVNFVISMTEEEVEKLFCRIENGGEE